MNLALSVCKTRAIPWSGSLFHGGDGVHPKSKLPAELENQDWRNAATQRLLSRKHFDQARDPPALPLLGGLFARVHPELLWRRALEEVANGGDELLGLVHVNPVPCVGNGLELCFWKEPFDFSEAVRAKNRRRAQMLDQTQGPSSAALCSHSG